MLITFQNLVLRTTMRLIPYDQLRIIFPTLSQQLYLFYCKIYQNVSYSNLKCFSCSIFNIYIFLGCRQPILRYHISWFCNKVYNSTGTSYIFKQQSCSQMLQISNDHTTLVTKSELFLKLYFYKRFYFVSKIMKILSKLRYLTQGKGTLHPVQSTEVFPLFYIQVASNVFSDILTLCFCNRIYISTDTYT